MAAIVQFRLFVDNADGTYDYWWARPDYWRAAYLADSIQRPTEDAALRAIYWQARAYRRYKRHAPGLTSEQRRLCTLEQRLMRDKPHLDAKARHAEIAAVMKWTARAVRLELEAVTELLIAMERARVLDVLTAAAQRRDKQELRITRGVLWELAAEKRRAA